MVKAALNSVWRPWQHTGVGIGLGCHGNRCSRAEQGQVDDVCMAHTLVDEQHHVVVVQSLDLSVLRRNT